MKCMLVSRCTAKHIEILLKETSILGMCIGERNEESTNGRKLWRQTVHGCTCARYPSLSLPLSFVLSFLFDSSILSR